MQEQLDIIYRRMEVSDLDQVMALGNVTDGFEVGDDSGFWDEETLRRWITDSDDPLIVAANQNELAGFILGAAHPVTKKITLENIVVAENYRRRGIASGLLDAFMEEASRLDMKYICALSKVTNTSAINFFEQSDFKRGADF